MDARLARAAVLVAAFVSLGASYRTPNFVVSAPTPQIAEQIGQQAEAFRRDLATLWLGSPLPNWSQPCPITAQVAENLGAGGATSFMFDGGEVYGWTMTIQGSLERILDSVLPHEVTHTIFASHFRRPLPRWADEGACTTVEHSSERGKQQQMLVTFLKTKRGIPFHSMFAMKEYPADVLPLYAQGHSLASYLIQQGGRQKFLNFVAAGLQAEQWPSVTKQFYGYNSLADLQNTWLNWVRSGSPAIQKPAPGPAPAGDALLADAGPRKRPEPNLIYRGQSSDDVVAGAAPNSRGGATNLAGSLVPVSRPPQRDRAAIANDMALAANTPLPGPGSWQPADAPAVRPGPSATQFAPPEAEAPRQKLLEWNRNGADGATAPAGTASNAGQGSASVYAGGGRQPVAAQ
jgi:hypothetical protein